MFQHRRAFAVLLYQCYTVVHYGARGLDPASSALMQQIPYLKELYMKELARLQRDYNPNPGNEPYWPLGGWVFDPDELELNGSTTKMQLVCGEECNYLFKRVKQVCAKRLSADAMDGCLPGWFRTCDGYYIDRLRGFETFATYCEFLDKKCQAHLAGDQNSYYVFVHVGPCVEQDNVFRPMMKPEWIVDRAQAFLSTLEDVFYNASLPSPQGLTRTAAPPPVTKKP